MDLICRFTANSLDLYQKMYAGEMLYKEMFSLESEFLEKWDQLTGFDSGLAEKTETINPPARLDDLTAEWERTDFASVSEEQTGKVNRQSGILSEKIDTLRQHFVMEKDFKIEHMIVALPINLLDTIFCNYAHMADLNQDRHPEILVGIYSSGAFLAHMINWVCRKDNTSDLPVTLFQPFPYILFQPDHKGWTSDALQSGRVVVCDESVKTGFTFSILEAHLRRVRRTLPCVLEVWSLFRHMDYQPVETKMTPVIRPLFAVNDKILHLLSSREFSDDAEPRQVQKWPLDIVGKKKLTEYLKTQQKNTDADRFDYTRIIADTRATFSLAFYFSQQIVEKRPKKDYPVFLFAPSACGRVLALATAYFLRCLNNGLNVRFVNSPERAKKAENAGSRNTFLVDLTLVTGFTAEHSWRMLTDRKCTDPVDLNKIMHPLVIEDFKKSIRV